MNEKTEKMDIGKYRKKKKLKKWLKRVIAIAVALALIGIGFLIWKIVEVQFNIESDTSAFPIALSGDLISQSKKQGSELVILTDKEIKFYNNKGDKKRLASHSYSTPAISCSDTQTLVYDIGGMGYSIETKGGNVFSGKAPSKIVLGFMAKNGNIALITEDDRYACKLIIYNQKGEEVFKWYSAENLITDLEFTDDGTGCVITAAGAKDGFPVGYLYGLSFSQTKELFQCKATDSLPISVHYMNGFIHVVSQNELVVLDKNGSQQNKVKFDNNVKLCVDAGNYTVLLFGETVKSTSTIVVYDRNGNVVGKTSDYGHVRTLDSDGKKVAILTEDSIFCFDMTLKKTAEYHGKQGSTILICMDFAGYDLSTTQLGKFNYNHL